MAGSTRFGPLARAVLRTQSDDRLVALVRDGTEAAFEEIVRRYRAPLVAFAAAYGPPDPEDLVQESLTRSWEALRESNMEMNLKPWLYTIVRNRALNARRDARPTQELPRRPRRGPPATRRGARARGARARRGGRLGAAGGPAPSAGAERPRGAHPRADRDRDRGHFRLRAPADLSRSDRRPPWRRRGDPAAVRRGDRPGRLRRPARSPEPAARPPAVRSAAPRSPARRSRSPRSGPSQPAPGSRSSARSCPGSAANSTGTRRPTSPDRTGAATPRRARRERRRGHGHADPRR